MSQAKYDGHFIRGPKAYETNEILKRYTVCLDDDVVRGSFFFNGAFMTPKYSTGIHGPHIHPYREALFFHGLDPDNPYKLDWEIELHMGPEFQTYIVDKTSIIYCPARFPHCPIISRIKRPAFHIYTMTGPLLVRDDYEEHIKQDGAFDKNYHGYFKSGPPPGKSDSPYTVFMDNDIIPGSFHFSSAFITKPSLPTEHDLHTHPDRVVLGFFGNDPENVFDLGAEIEISMGPEQEKHVFNQATAVFLPPGLVHGAVKVKKLQRPFIFVTCSDGHKLVDQPYRK